MLRSRYCFNPIWGGFGIRGTTYAGVIFSIGSFNPIWGGFGIRGSCWYIQICQTSMFQSYLRWIRYSRAVIFTPWLWYLAFQSYLRWIRYSRLDRAQRLISQMRVSILFEVDSVFEEEQMISKPRQSSCFNPIWGGFGIRGAGLAFSTLIETMFQSYLRWIRYSRSFLLLQEHSAWIVSILFEVDSVFEELRLWSHLHLIVCFNPIWGGFGIRGCKKGRTVWSSYLVSILFEVDSVFEAFQGQLIEEGSSGFNPIWGGFGIRGK